MSNGLRKPAPEHFDALPFRIHAGRCGHPEPGCRGRAPSYPTCGEGCGLRPRGPSRRGSAPCGPATWCDFHLQKDALSIRTELEGMRTMLAPPSICRMSCGSPKVPSPLSIEAPDAAGPAGIRRGAHLIDHHKEAVEGVEAARAPCRIQGRAALQRAQSGGGSWASMTVDRRAHTSRADQYGTIYGHRAARGQQPTRQRSSTRVQIGGAHGLLLRLQQPLCDDQ